MFDSIRPQRISCMRARVEPLEERRLLSGVVTTVATFSEAEDFDPSTLVVDNRGNLYGATATSVVEIPAGAHNPITLTTFPSFANPQLAMDGAGNLYGVGGNGLFELTAGNRNLIQIPGGANLHDLIADTSGNLYGFALGTNGVASALVEVSAQTHAVTTLVGFGVGSVPFEASNLVRDAAGDLFWVADALKSSEGYGYGSIVKLAVGTDSPVGIYVVVDFEGNMICDAAGDLYLNSSSAGGLVELAAGTSQPDSITCS